MDYYISQTNSMFTVYLNTCLIFVIAIYLRTQYNYALNIEVLKENDFVAWKNRTLKELFSEQISYLDAK